AASFRPMTSLPLATRPLDATIMLHDSQRVSLAAFLGRANALAARLPPGAPVINLCRDRHAFSVTFAATLLAGGCNLLPANRLTATVDDLTATFPEAVVVSDQALAGFSGATVDPADSLACDQLAASIPRVDAEQLA